MTNTNKAEDKDWDLVITGKKSLISLQLADIWRYRDLIILFVRRDFVAQYKQTILGPLWYLIQPVLTTLMFLIPVEGAARLRPAAVARWRPGTAGP
jgi:lipopolysaccharide transport system permease protein